MALFLPHRVWLLGLGPGWHRDKAFRGQKVERYTLSMFGDEETDGDLLLLRAEYDPSQLADNPHVRSTQQAWMLCTEDPIDFPDKPGPGARLVEDTEGSALIFTDHDQALEQLATVSEDVRPLLELRRAGEPSVQGLAQAVLE